MEFFFFLLRTNLYRQLYKKHPKNKDIFIITFATLAQYVLQVPYNYKCSSHKSYTVPVSSTFLEQMS